MSEEISPIAGTHTQTTSSQDDSLFVISDSDGFIGAFLSLSEAKVTVLNKHPLIPFLVQRFKLAKTGVETVWIVPYNGSNAIAFASNDRTEAERVQKSLNLVGLTYTDSIDYWEQPIGRVVPSANERLLSIDRAHKMYADPAVKAAETARDLEMAAGIEKMLKGNLDDPISRLLREHERIGFMDCIVEFVSEETPSEETPLEAPLEAPLEETPLEETPLETTN